MAKQQYEVKEGKQEDKKEDKKDKAKYYYVKTKSRSDYLDNTDIFMEHFGLVVTAFMGVTTCKSWRYPPYIFKDYDDEFNEVDKTGYGFISKAKQASKPITEDFLKNHGKDLHGIAEEMIAATLLLDMDCIGPRNFSNVRYVERKNEKGELLYYELVKFDFGCSVLDAKGLKDIEGWIDKNSHKNKRKECNLENVANFNHDLENGNILEFFSHDELINVKPNSLSNAYSIFKYVTKEQKINALVKLKFLDFNELEKLIKKVIPQGFVAEENMNEAISQIKKRREAILKNFEKELKDKDPIVSLYPDCSDLKHHKGKTVEIQGQEYPKIPRYKLESQKKYHVDSVTSFRERFAPTGKEGDIRSLSQAQQYIKKTNNQSFVKN